MVVGEIIKESQCRCVQLFWNEGASTTHVCTRLDLRLYPPFREHTIISGPPIFSPINSLRQLQNSSEGPYPILHLLMYKIPSKMGINRIHQQLMRQTSLNMDLGRVAFFAIWCWKQRSEQSAV